MLDKISNIRFVSLNFIFAVRNGMYIRVKVSLALKMVVVKMNILIISDYHNIKMFYMCLKITWNEILLRRKTLSE